MSAPKSGSAEASLGIPPEYLHPTPKLPYLGDPRFRTKRCGGTFEKPFDIFIFRDVLEELCYRAAFNAEKAAFSILLGGWFVGPTGPYIEIEGFQDSIYTSSTLKLAEHLSHRPDLFEFEPPAPPGRETGPRNVGYCLVLPGSLGEIGPDEVLLHNTYFNLPHQVLLLIDAEGDFLGFYARGSKHRFQNLPFWLVDDATEESPALDEEWLADLLTDFKETT